MLKKRYLFLILIICLFAISAVSAEEIDNKTDITVNSQDSLMCESVDESFLSESYGTFQELQEEINAVEDGGTLNLTKDYKYVNCSNKVIELNRTIIIDGKGHTIDGNKTNLLFNIGANNILLKNITFTNFIPIDYDSGAIMWNGNNGILTNCTVKNCGKYYGAIMWNGENGTLSNCMFSENKADEGAAIYWAGDNGNITNCTFINNTDYMSAVVSIWASNISVFNCNFIDNPCIDSGLLHLVGFYNSVQNCSFINNTGNSVMWGQMDTRYGFLSDCIFINNSKGSAISWYSDDGYIGNSIFINNSNSHLWADIGIIYCRDNENGEIFNCTFINNSVTNGKTIWWYGYMGSNRHGTIKNSYFSEDFDNFDCCEGIKIIKNDCMFDYHTTHSTYQDLNESQLLGSDGFLTNKPVTVHISNGKNNKTFIKYTNETGWITFEDYMDYFTSGIWNVTLVFEGNDNYCPCNISFSQTINLVPTSLIMGDINSIFGDEIIIKANVTRLYGEAVNKGSVSFFDGKNNIGESEVTNGIATLIYTPMSDGEHQIAAIFTGDNYLSSNATSKLFVDSANVEVLVFNGTVGFESNFTANVKGLYSIINEGTVSFYVDDEYLGKESVVNGVANLTYIPLIAGDYVVRVVYADSNHFLDDENSTGYIVSKADSETSISDSYVIIANEVILTANVSSSNNLTINEGYVTFFDGETNIGESEVTNGVATLSYTSKVDGEHQIIAIFAGDNYLESNATAKLLVDSASVEILVNDTTVGFNTTVVVIVKALYSDINDGNAYFLNFGTPVPVVNGTANLTFVPLNAGDYYIDVEFGNRDFSPEYVYSQTTYYHVYGADTSIGIEDFNATVGYETTLTANISSSNNLTINEGIVEFYIDGELIGESYINEGLSSLTFTPQNSGNYTIKAVFNGTNNYLVSNNNSKLIVNKASTLISIEDISAVYYSNQVIFTVNITSNSNKVNGGKVKFYVDNKEVGSVNVENGVASLSYIAPIVGNYDLGAVFEESDNYLSSNATAVFDVIKMPTTLSGNSIIFDDNDTKTYTTVLLDDNHNGVYNKSVGLLVIKYSGEYSTFNAVTDSNGISIYDINSLKGGMWYVSGSFDGDNNYINSSFVDKFIVIKVETTTNIEEIDNPKVNHTYKLKANIHDEDGKLVKEGIVQFYLDGVDIGSIDLSKHGANQNNDLLGIFLDSILGDDEEEPYLEYTPTKAGNFILSAVYEGTTVYKSSNSTTDFVVQDEDAAIISAPDLTKFYHGPERFVVTVKDNDNKPVVGKNVTIYLNGATYTRTTNENGEASMAINLNSGVYEALTKYNTSEVKSTITIKETVSGENITKMFRNGTQYYATFYDTSGKTLANNTAVEFNINGVFYTRYTNDKGVARMNINLNPGEYVITAKNPNSTEQYTNIITVLPSIVEIHNLTKYYKNESKLTFRLLDDQGMPVGAGVSAKININGVFYTRQTNASGYVNMNINLNPGTYIATLEYNGLMASSTVKVLPILEAKNVDMKYKDGTKFEAKLLDGHGNPFAGQSITFNINGVFYNRSTDENGIARLAINLMAGEYIITSMYEPNGAAISNKVTVRS